ncbi:hypothetical protein D3C80_1920030 [compost metagenome]
MDLAQLLFDNDHHAMHRIRDLTGSECGFQAATEHQLVGLADAMAGLDHLPDDCIQMVDKTVDPTAHISGLVVGHARGVQTLTQIALAFSDGPDHTGHFV